MTVGARQRGPATRPAWASVSSRSPDDPDGGWGGLALSVGWLVAVAFASLGATFLHGTVLGPSDFLRIWGLTGVPGTHVRNVVSNDLIQLFMPWTKLAWLQVHHGILPLWNPYSGLGMPFAFNIESATSSLPMLVGYAVPLRWAYTAGIVAKLVLAGTGAYLAARALGADQLGAAFAGTVFELSGGLTTLDGWSAGGVFALAGWVIGAAVLVVAGRHRVRDVSLLAVAIAFCVYGGHPESTTVVTITAVTVVMVLLVACWQRSGRSVRSLGRPVADLTAATAAGLALAAPLLLPGAQLIAGSARLASIPYRALPAADLTGLVFAGFYGYPYAGSHYIGDLNYYETTMFVGAVALVLAIVAVARRWRSPHVLATAAGVAVTGALVFVEPVAWALSRLPLTRDIVWRRAIGPLDLVLALLAGVGLSILHRHGGERPVRRSLALAGTGLAAVLLAVFVGHLSAHLGPAAARQQLRSFLWPTVTLVAVVCAVVLTRRALARPGATRSRRRSAQRARLVACLTLGAAESAFLLTAAPYLWSSAPHAFVETPAVSAFQRDVGSARVGFGACVPGNGMPPLGIVPNANVGYGVAELSVYDPMTPRSYFTAWAQATHGVGTPPVGMNFCPSVTSARLARHFGVSFILEAPGHPGPTGTSLVATLAGEGLYRVPGSGLVTLASPGSSADRPQRVLPVRQGTTPTLTTSFTARQRSVVYLHISDVPGWQATLDGRPVRLRPWGGDMFAVDVPAGRQVLVATYHPMALTVGEACALIAVIALIVAALVTSFRHDARRRTNLTDRRSDERPIS